MPNPRYPHLQPGDEPAKITADAYNARNAEIERRSRLSVSGGLRLGDGGTARTISRAGDGEFWAKVTGTGNPYAFAQAVIAADGTFAVLSGGYTGDGTSTGARAYEVNAVANLDGRYAWLVPGSAGDWRFQHVADGSGTSIYPPNACTTYRVQVRNQAGAPNGAPQSGIAASLARRQGSITPPNGTAAPVSGVTDGNGWFTYALSQTTPENVTSGSATIPDGGPTVTNTAAVKVGSVCTYLFILCRRYEVTHYLDGDGDAPLGDKQVRKYILSTGDGTGNPTNSATYSFTVQDPLPDPAAWWYDKVVNDSINNGCDGTDVYHKRFWSKAKYNQGRSGGGNDNRSSVYLKQMCVRVTVVQGGVSTTYSYPVTWDDTTWDGDYVGPYQPSEYDPGAPGFLRMTYSGGGVTLVIYKSPPANGIYMAVDTPWGGGTSTDYPIGGNGPTYPGILNNNANRTFTVQDGPCASDPYDTGGSEQALGLGDNDPLPDGDGNFYSVD